MTRNEVLEFLELPESASDADIRVRLNDKLAYFQRLSENAPNEFLRQLHIANTEKVKQMRAEFIGAKGSEAKPASTAAKTEIGWLIRHTENQSANTFPW